MIRCQLGPNLPDLIRTPVQGSDVQHNVAASAPRQDKAHSLPTETQRFQMWSTRDATIRTRNSGHQFRAPYVVQSCYDTGAKTIGAQQLTIPDLSSYVVTTDYIEVVVVV